MGLVESGDVAIDDLDDSIPVLGRICVAQHRESVGAEWALDGFVCDEAVEVEAVAGVQRNECTVAPRDDGPRAEVREHISEVVHFHLQGIGLRQRCRWSSSAAIDDGDARPRSNGPGDLSPCMRIAHHSREDDDRCLLAIVLGGFRIALLVDVDRQEVSVSQADLFLNHLFHKAIM
nr:hypothetical protein [Brevibacterium atlanticum]